MKYLLINGALAVWVFLDARKRLNSPIGWTVGTLFFGFIMLPLYLAMRNLNYGESREGGTAWIVARNMALWWTVTILSLITLDWFSSMIQISRSVPSDPLMAYAFNSRERAGAEALGTTLGSAILVGFWFVSTIVIVAFGLLFKKQTVEVGPTGSLARKPPIISAPELSS